MRIREYEYEHYKYCEQTNISHQLLT